MVSGVGEKQRVCESAMNLSSSLRYSPGDDEATKLIQMLPQYR